MWGPSELLWIRILHLNYCFSTLWRPEEYLVPVEKKVLAMQYKFHLSPRLSYKVSFLAVKLVLNAESELSAVLFQNENSYFIVRNNQERNLWAILRKLAASLCTLSHCKVCLQDPDEYIG